MTDRHDDRKENDFLIRYTDQDAWWRPVAGNVEGEPRFVPAGTPIPPPGTMLVEGRLTVQLAPEYGVTTPLWPQAEGSVVLRLIPPELLERLHRWQVLFDSSFHWDTGWQSKSAKMQWTSDAADLERDLREVLDGRVELEINLWPLRDERSSIELVVEKWIVEDGQIAVPSVGGSFVGALELWCWEVDVASDDLPSHLVRVDRTDPDGRFEAVHDVVGVVVASLGDAVYLDVDGLIVFVHGREGILPASPQNGATYRMVATVAFAPEGTGAYWPDGGATIRTWTVEEVVETQRDRYIVVAH